MSETAPARPWVAERWLARACIVVLLAAPLLMFWGATRMEVFLGDGETFAMNLSLWVYIAEHWRQGVFPLWAPELAGGFPIVGDPHAGLFQPLKLLFLFLPPLVAFNAIVLLHHGFAGLFSYLLAREEGLASEAALVAGIAFSFCGFLMGVQAQTAFFASATLIPLPCWLFRRALRTRSYRSLVLGTLGIAWLLLSGGAQMILFALFFGGLYAGWVLVSACPPDRRVHYAVFVVATVVLGAALAAPQWLPAAELKSLSVRDSIDFETFVGKWSPSPWSLLVGLLSTRIVIAYYQPAAEGLLHVGPLVVLLAAIAALRVDRRALFWAALAVFAYLACLGDRTPVMALLYEVPGYNLFRLSIRHAVLLDFAVAMLAAHGAQRLAEAAPARANATPIRLAAALGAVLAFWMILLPSEQAIAQAIRSTLGSPGPSVSTVLAPVLAYAAGVAAIAVLLARYVRGRAIAVVCAVLSLIFFAGYRTWTFRAPLERIAPLLDRDLVFPAWPPEGDVERPAEYRVAMGAPVMWLNFRRDGREDWRLRYARSGGPQLNLLYGIDGVAGMSPLALARYSRLLGGLNSSGALTDERIFSPPVSDLLNLRYVLAPEEYAWPDGAFASLERMETVEGITLWRNPDAPGLFWPVARVEAAPEAEIWERIRQPGFDVRSLALIEDRDAVPSGADFDGHARVDARYQGPHRIAIDIEASRAVFLASSHPWYPGWRAEIDGRPARLVLTDGVFAGLVVPAGARRVELHYRPTSLLLGLGIAACACGALVAGRWWGALR